MLLLCYGFLSFFLSFSHSWMWLVVMNKCLTIILNTLAWDQHANTGGIASLFVCIAGGLVYQQAPMRSEKPKVTMDAEDDAFKSDVSVEAHTNEETMELLEKQEEPSQAKRRGWSCFVSLNIYVIGSDDPWLATLLCKHSRNICHDLATFVPVCRLNDQSHHVTRKLSNRSRVQESEYCFVSSRTYDFHVYLLHSSMTCGGGWYVKVIFKWCLDRGPFSLASATPCVFHLLNGTMFYSTPFRTRPPNIWWETQSAGQAEYRWVQHQVHYACWLN